MKEMELVSRSSVHDGSHRGEHESSIRNDIELIGNN